MRLKTIIGLLTLLSVTGLGLSNAEAKSKALTRKDVSKYVREGEYDTDGTPAPKKSTKRKLTAKAKSKATSKRVVAAHSKSNHQKNRAPASIKTKSRAPQRGYTPQRTARKPAQQKSSRKKVPAHSVKRGKTHASQGRAAPRRPASVRSSSRRPTSTRRHSSVKPLTRRVSEKEFERATADDERLPYARETPHEKDMPFISIPSTRVRKSNKTIVMEDPGTRPAALKPSLSEPLDNSEPKPVEQREPAAVAAPAPPAEASNAAALKAETGAPREPDAFDIHSGADPMHTPGAD